jgi:outer membrane protein assembly factor BamB
VVAGDRVWIHTRRANREVVTSLRLATGEVRWSQEYPAPFQQDPDGSAHGCGPYATPALDGKRLFTVGVRSVLSVWDAESGTLLWRKSSGDEFNPSFPFFGMASSPLVWREFCYIHMGGHERTTMEAPGKGAMVAYRVPDGRQVWRWAGDGPALGASPLVCTIANQPQLVFKTKKLMAGLNPHTGAELWRVPFTVPMDNTIATPLVIGDRLITSDYDLGVRAWRIALEGGWWKVREIWRTRDVSLFMNSPVPVAGLVMGFSHFRKGQTFLIDPVRGEVVWRGQARSGEHATILAWGDKALVFGDDGFLVAGEVKQRAFNLLGRYRLGNGVGWAHPAVAGNRLVVKDGVRLAVYQLPD